MMGLRLWKYMIHNVIIEKIHAGCLEIGSLREFCICKSVWDYKLRSVTAFLPSIASVAFSENPHSLIKSTASFWSSHGLSEPNNMRSAPWMLTIFLNFSIGRLAL